MTRTSRLINRLIFLIMATYALVGLAMRPTGDAWCEYTFARVLGPVDAAVFWYQTWGGRFTAYGLNSILYSIFDKMGPAVLPTILIVATIGVWSYAIRPYTKKALLLSATVFYGTIAGFQNIYHNFYYPAASLVYFAPLVLIGLLAAGLIRRWHILIIVAVAFLCGGVNEPQAGLLIVALLVFWWRTRSYRLIAAIVAVGLGLLVNVLAPGNALRGDLAEPSLSLGTITLAGSSVLWQAFRTATANPLALLIPFAAGLIAAPRQPILHARRWMILIGIGVLLVGWISVTPTVITLTWAPLRIFTLAQALFAVAACAIGLISGSLRSYSADILAVLVVGAFLLTIGWVVQDVPGLLADAIAFDWGYITNTPSYRAGVILNDAPYIVSCIEGNTIPLYTFGRQ